MLRSQCHDVFPSTVEEPIAVDHERTGPLLDEGRKSGLEVGITTGA